MLFLRSSSLRVSQKGELTVSKSDLLNHPHLVLDGKNKPVDSAEHCLSSERSSTATD